MDSQENYNENIHFLHHKYSSALLPKKNQSQFDAVHYHFIIDESTSVTSNNYRIITSCCKKQVEVMDFDGTSNAPKTKVSVFRFNEKSKLALEASSDRQTIFACLNNLPYGEGCTDAKVALEEAYRHIQKHNNPKTHHVVILMTDGDLGDASNIIQKITNEQSISIKLAVVFMGFEVQPTIYTKYHLEEHQVIRFKNFIEMESVFNLFTERKASIKPTIEHIGLSTITARLYLSVPRSGLIIDHFQYEIYDENLKEITGPRKARFDEIVIDGLEPGTSYRVRVCSVYKNGVKSDWTDPEKFKTYSKVAIIEWLKDHDKALKKHKELLEKLPAAQVHPSLKQLGFRHANILLLGLMGHGKSSFINTATSTFASRYCTPALTQCNPYQTCTTTIKEVDILAYLNQHKNNYIHFFDSFGIRHNRNGQKVPSERNFENSNYGECLKHILSGDLPSGYKEWSHIDTDAMNSDHTNINKMIHSIGFIVDIVAMKQEGDLKIIREFLQKIQESSKYRPLVIFTKCDVIMQKDLSDKQKPKLKDIWNNQALRQAIEYFLEQVPCVEESDIMLFSNYTSKYDSNEERDYERELLLLYILDTLKERAEGFVRSHLENYVKVVNDDDEYVGDFCFRTNADRIADYEVQFIKILRELRYPVDIDFEVSYQDDRSRLKTETRSNLFRNNCRMELQDLWIKEDGFSKIKILFKPVAKIAQETEKSKTPTPNSTKTVQGLDTSQSFVNPDQKTSDVYLSFASELEKSKKKIKCRQQETLKDLRQRLSLPPNEVFSKQSIGKEGIFTEPEEAETVALEVMKDCSLQVVLRPTMTTPSQSSSNDKIFISCSCKNFMKPFKVKGTNAAEIRKELASRQVEHFQKELILLYVDGFDIDASDESEVKIEEMVSLNDEGQNQIRCKCSAS